MSMQLKELIRCSGCGETKTHREFYASCMSLCMVCKRAQARAYQQKRKFELKFPVRNNQVSIDRRSLMAALESVLTDPGCDKSRAAAAETLREIKGRIA